MSKIYKNENAVVDDIWKTLKVKFPNLYILKIHGGQYQEAGIPDLMTCIDGLMVAPEVKHWKPGESFEHMLDRTTHRQRQHIARIVRAGGMAGTVWDPESALHLVQLARLKQKMIQEGRPEKEYPLPPHWDYLMRVDPKKIIPNEPVRPIPHPKKEIQ